MDQKPLFALGVSTVCVSNVRAFPSGGLMGPVRMISSGHELTTDYDEKTLHELGFKDMQVNTCTHLAVCP